MHTLPRIAGCNSGAARVFEEGGWKCLKCLKCRRCLRCLRCLSACIACQALEAPQSPWAPEVSCYGGVIPDAALKRYGSAPPPSRYMPWHCLHVCPAAPAVVVAFI